MERTALAHAAGVVGARTANERDVDKSEDHDDADKHASPRDPLSPEHDPWIEPAKRNPVIRHVSARGRPDRGCRSLPLALEPEHPSNETPPDRTRDAPLLLFGIAVPSRPLRQAEARSGTTLGVPAVETTISGTTTATRAVTAGTRESTWRTRGALRRRRGRTRRVRAVDSAAACSTSTGEAGRVPVHPPEQRPDRAKRQQGRCVRNVTFVYRTALGSRQGSRSPGTATRGCQRQPAPISRCIRTAAPT